MPLPESHKTPPPNGPQITAFGLTQADNTVLDPSAYDTLGRPVYIRSAGLSGGASGFFIFVEAKPDQSGLSPGQQSGDQTGDGRPDFQILPSQDLGNGSAEVCDSIPPIGGIPGVPSLDFDSVAEASTVTAILNDFACRFDNNTSLPCTNVQRGRSQRLREQGDHDAILQRAIDRHRRTLPPGRHVLAVRWRATLGETPFAGRKRRTTRKLLRIGSPKPIGRLSVNRHCSVRSVIEDETN